MVVAIQVFQMPDREEMESPKKPDQKYKNRIKNKVFLKKLSKTIYEFDNGNHFSVISSEEGMQSKSFLEIAELDILKNDFLGQFYDRSKLIDTSITREEFRRVVEAQVEVLAMEAALNHLGEAPKRKFVPYKDDIVEFLLADDGWGPWNEAGLLSTPRLKQHDATAYRALYNHGIKRLPPTLNIRNQSEISDFLAAPLTALQRRAGGAMYHRK
jgi:hypothetical protein